MFKKLKSRKEFLRVHNNGLKAVTKGLIIQSLNNKENQNIKRFGFTASRKIGNSVIRNRAKRRLRALVQINFKEQRQNLTEFKWSDIEILNYKHHEAIKAQMVA